MIDNSVYMANGIDIGEPLDSEGAFHLRAWPKHSVWESVIVHECDDCGGEPHWMAPYQPLPDPCPGCDQLIPQKLVVAWMLHNFDRIGEYDGGDDGE